MTTTTVLQEVDTTAHRIGDLPLLRRGPAADICRPGHVAAVRDLSFCRRSESWRDLYPLHVYVCEKCWLVQLEEYESAENIFSDYAYFASYSDSWLKHCEKYCNEMRARFGLGRTELCGRSGKQ